MIKVWYEGAWKLGFNYKDESGAGRYGHNTEGWYISCWLETYMNIGYCVTRALLSLYTHLRYNTTTPIDWAVRTCVSEKCLHRQETVRWLMRVCICLDSSIVDQETQTLGVNWFNELITFIILNCPPACLVFFCIAPNSIFPFLN